MPRALWVKAPLVLLRHPAVLVAVLAASMLVSIAAASAPLLRAGARSEALKSKLDQLTPLGAGLTIETPPRRDPDPARADRARRAAVRRLAASLPFVGPPVLATTGLARVGGNVLEGGIPLLVVPMARTGANAHVTRLSGDGEGAWVAAPVVRLARVRAGGRLTLISPSAPGAGGAHTTVKVGAVYRSLDADRDNPYWVDYVVRIRTRNPDAPPLPTFLLVDQAELYRIAHAVGGDELANTFELPVDAHDMTVSRAKGVTRRFDEIRRSLQSATPLARSLGCVPPARCSVTSSLDAAVALADQSVGALTSVISLLAGFAALIAVAAALVAGAFNVRRRTSEARLSVFAGETRTAFTMRAGLEALVPALGGGVAGLAIAAGLARALTPAGTIDRHVLLVAVAAGGLAALTSVVAVAAGACAARGPTIDGGAPRLRLAVVPWEIPVLAAAVALLVVVEHGGGLVTDPAIGAHPRLVVLMLPLLAGAGVAGLGARVARRLLRRRAARADAIFLALRRLAAARGLLVILTVTASASFAALCFAEVLDASLSANSAEKAYVANGADVQGLIDPGQTFPPRFPYPLAKVRQSLDTVRVDTLPSPLEVLEVDPKALGRVLRWHWSGDPAGALRALASAEATPLPVIAGGAARGASQIAIGGAHIPIRVVATVSSFPGLLAGEPLLVVPAGAFERAAARAGVGGDPLDQATTYVWVRGDPATVVPALERSTIAPSYITTVDHFLQSAELTTVTRTYAFLRVVALGAALVALAALLLYLHARGRSQLVTSAFLARMGMGAQGQAVSLALEAAALVAFAVVVGGGCALLVARALVTRVDPLPQYAPGATVVVPWALLAGSACVLVAAAAAVGAVVSLLASRAPVGEALRVA